VSEKSTSGKFPSIMRIRVGRIIAIVLNVSSPLRFFFFLLGGLVIWGGSSFFFFLLCKFSGEKARVVYDGRFLGAWPLDQLFHGVSLGLRRPSFVILF